ERPNDRKILNANESIVVYKDVPLAKAGIDKGGLLKRVVQSAMDALTQQAINSRSSVPAPSGGGSVPSVPNTAGSGAGDKDNSPAPAPPAPPPPSPPPPAAQ